ncbi:MAG: folate-binding protein [Gammaproteobacteria bacterium]
MTDHWKFFLERSGAVFAGARLLGFGAPERENQALAECEVICDLSGLGVIAASGPNAATFLQGQLSNDIREVTPQRSHLSAYCNPQGRMLAILRLFQRDDVYYLRLPSELVEAMLKRLRLFVLRAKAELHDASNGLVRVGASGSHAAALLQAYLGELPHTTDDVVQARGISAIRLPDPRPRFEMHGAAAALEPLWTALAGELQPVGADAWRWLDIQAGIPTIYPATSGVFIPQMANLHLLNGVSFKKGCYTGQEIVARSQYLGKLKRHLLGARTEGRTQPNVGDEVFLSTAPSSDAIGTILDASRDPRGGYALLAIVQDEVAEQELVLKTGEPLQRLPLPAR